MSRDGHRPRWTADRLAVVAAESSSLVDALRRLGGPLGSGPLGYLRRRLAHHGIDTRHFAAEAPPPRERRSYTRAALEEAVARAHSFREVVEWFGVPPYSSTYGHLKRRIERFGIDTSHFDGADGRGGRLDEARLREAVSGARSLAEVTRRLGLVPGGASRARIKRYLDAYGVPVRGLLGQAHNRGRPSPRRKSADEILRALPPGSPRVKSALLRRALREKGVPARCAKCGTGEVWHGRRLVLEIDHVSGDSDDNRIENLRHLCPSCHSQTGNFARWRGR
ncbi:HNH endonuclease [Streptomyces sp. PTM05]|uniref:HNH endonuclease n=1 Tax=Streptantibioticus parmotrematis TaxID=2873249 RepID=A0ABS7QZ82_9ACTN|nr:HNH endonuclease signature motif containing protein [Streptantibioticus parmotrematis]MBY8887959.1 HNH endonuclease [Streptantibioticus parmotrematis]